MTRWKAFGLHLLLSLTLISGIALAALLTWYPHGLWKISGLDRLMAVMLVIDMTAGPLLTLVIYKPGKWGLGFDLKVIAVVQAGFLAYGLHTLWLSRPVFLVGADVRFTLVSASDISPEDLAKAARPEWRKLPWTGPYLVGVAPPVDPADRSALLDRFMETGRDQEQLPDQYRPYTEVAGLIRHKIVALDGQQGRPQAGDSAKGLPIYSRDDEGWMLVDPNDGGPLRVLKP
ncbi:type IV pilin accessory protein [Pseudoxanthomonas jiangsuensis]|uniref:type IV pilin accessory protein n=1 Tax=Pseudoxanthomonas jiangsuensis TaxID=619688 RepID=UPI001391994D|nr:type IV pilin accessory protein [Pseudoxanthomonas jiangsuensis]KAF1697892.1 type IV pilin accessory protein [Pseudoxanthomonas jiangsuensis]